MARFFKLELNVDFKVDCHIMTKSEGTGESGFEVGALSDCAWKISGSGIKKLFERRRITF